MKTDTTVLGVTISLLLLALPAAASDYTLGIFGNANEDETINMQDVTYTELIILEYRDRTDLADAKYDGKINMQDVTQIELIILGREKELTLIDTADRTVTVKKPVERIIIVNRNVLETMRSLKATGNIVGVTRAVTTDNIFFPEFSDFPSIGSGKTPDFERILELQPDVVFYYGTQWPDRLEEIDGILHDADPGIAVVAFDCFKPEWYIEETRKLGYILDKGEEAAKFIDFYEGCKMPIMEIVEGISEEDKPKVCMLRKFYTTYGVGSVEHQMIVAAGGDNVFSDLFSTGAAVDAEEVIERDPEFIIWIHRWAGGYLLDVDDTAELEAMKEEVMNRPELQKVPAVESGNVYVVTNDVYRGARDFVGIGYLAKWFYPELFEDLDPKATHQEYLTRFQGLDYDLGEQGVFVYPQSDES
ncbi:MAG: ABC transporter substrate-binding protein [Euryarchaeota archaeon]|nr:ABC transporter substrate-binding protein [Euryarchaeota archaeon]